MQVFYHRSSRPLCRVRIHTSLIIGANTNVVQFNGGDVEIHSHDIGENQFLEIINAKNVHIGSPSESIKCAGMNVKAENILLEGTITTVGDLIGHATKKMLNKANITVKGNFDLKIGSGN
jgi:hypothetical protein